MKKMEHYEFEPPKLLGILCDRSVPASFQKRIDLILKRRALPFVCLPFKVEAKYLKNVIACMRLMDIEGLIVLGKHERTMKKHVGHLSPEAKRARTVNVIVKKNKVFIGHYVQRTPSFLPDIVKLLTNKGHF